MIGFVHNTKIKERKASKGEGSMCEKKKFGKVNITSYFP